MVFLCYSSEQNASCNEKMKKSRRHKKFQLNILFIGALLRNGTSDKRLECSSVLLMKDPESHVTLLFGFRSTPQIKYFGQTQEQIAMLLLPGCSKYSNV